jgi:hypothetical protein
MTPRTLVHDLPPDMFPMTIEWWHEPDGQLLHRLVVAGAGVAVVPALGPHVCVWTRYGDGSTSVATSAGAYAEAQS